MAARETEGRVGVPTGLDAGQRAEWIGAKMVGRHPSQPGTGWDGTKGTRPDNDFLFGAEDPMGLRCPFGAHVRRTNPRESFAPGSQR